MQSTGVHTLPETRGGVYYGWVVLGVAALAMVGTLPGRTQGLGLITEPLLRDLGLGRVAYAQINLVATLIGALGCFGVDREHCGVLVGFADNHRHGQDGAGDGVLRDGHEAYCNGFESQSGGSR